jgi:hypothetical protein
MTRQESETVIRRLVEEWVELRGVTQGPSEAPSFSDFYSWLQQVLALFRVPERHISPSRC